MAAAPRAAKRARQRYTVPINGTTSNKLRRRKFQRYVTVFCKPMSKILKYFATGIGERGLR